MRIHGDLGELLEIFIAPPAGIRDVNQKASKANDAELKIMQAKHELEKLGIKYGAL